MGRERVVRGRSGALVRGEESLYCSVWLLLSRTVYEGGKENKGGNAEQGDRETRKDTETNQGKERKNQIGENTEARMYILPTINRYY